MAKKRPVQESNATETVYQGKPVLCLNPETEFGKFSFGVAKAKLIVLNIEAIKKFVDKHDPL